MLKTVARSKTRIVALVTFWPRGTRQYTVTGVPMAATPLAHSMSMAEFVTRAQPCDAGWAGMLPEPWMAMPPLKYFGR
jgi:hypothetical protein